MAHPDLYAYTETALMNAGYHLSKAQEGFVGWGHLDNALQQAEWAVEGLRALRQRSGLAR